MGKILGDGVKRMFGRKNPRGEPGVVLGEKRHQLLAMNRPGQRLANLHFLQDGMLRVEDEVAIGRCRFLQQGKLALSGRSPELGEILDREGVADDVDGAVQ